MKEIIKMEKSKAKENSTGLMEVLMKEILMIILFMAKVSTNGPITELTMVIGNSIKCMDKDYLSGQMEGLMLEST